MINLFISKEFMDNYFLEYSEKKDFITRKFDDFIFRCADKEIYTNVNIEANDNELFFLLQDSNIVYFGQNLDSIEDNIHLICDTTKHLEKASLCISFETLQEDFESIWDKPKFSMSQLSADFNQKLQSGISGLTKLPFKSLEISDKYLFDKKEEVKSITIPLIEKLLESSEKVNLLFVSDKVKDISTLRKVQSRLSRFQTKVSYVRVLDRFNNSLGVFHDRNIISELFLIDFGYGLNKTKQISNANISCNSTFDYDTYYRAKELRENNEKRVNKTRSYEWTEDDSKTFWP